mgnify:CR=1 FL=1
MRIRRFTASDIREAMGMVRSQLGPNAVILQTRRFRSGGFFGLFGRPMVEVTAAVDDGGRLPAYPSSLFSPTRRAVGAHKKDGAQGWPSASSEKYQGGRQDAEDRTRAGAGGDNGARSTGAVVESVVRIQDELRELKGMVRTLVEERQDRGCRPLPGDAPSQNGLVQSLLDQGVADDLARTMVAMASAPARNGGGKQDGDLSSRLRTVICEWFGTPEPISTGGEGPKVVCMVGPTGVGKTTTIAKLAAEFCLVKEARVGLVTVDTYRIAAVEQLKTYAEIIGVPVEVAYTPRELERALERLAGVDLILIDTAGRNHKNSMQMSEMKAFVQAADPDEVHLVLSSTTNDRDFPEILARFGEVGYDRLVITKLDETDHPGTLLNLRRMTDKPCSYFTDGQSVPDDIREADPGFLADLILGGVEPVQTDAGSFRRG